MNGLQDSRLLSVLLLPRLNKKYLYHHPSCFLLFGLTFWEIHSVFCPSVDDGGAGWWQNGQFGKIRFDPWPALQPITIQYPRLTGLPTNLLLILDRDQKGRQNVLIKNLSLRYFGFEARVQVGADGASSIISMLAHLPCLLIERTAFN